MASRPVQLLSPGDPDQRTGGYLYNARLAEALERAGWQVRVHAVPGDWPVPTTDAHGALLRSLPPGPVLADGLMWTGAAADWLAHRSVVLVHSPLGVEGDEALQAAEVRALSGVRAVVSTGGPTQRDLAALGVPSVRLVPGVGHRGRRTPPARAGLVSLLALATVTPRKRLDRLVDAVAAVPGCVLTVAGSLDRDPACVRAVRERAAERGVEARVRWAGEVDDDGVQALLDDCDLLVHGARYEAWGMALSEAMARGVPVLSTPAGALEAGGGRVVDAAHLPEALAELVADPAARQALADEAWRVGQHLPTWDDVAERVGALLEVR